MNSDIIVEPPPPMNGWLEDVSLLSLLQPPHYHPWLCSIVAAILVGLAGVVPLIFVPSTYCRGPLKEDGSVNILQLLLSFAVGGLLADVFLHLLPEAWATAIKGGLSPNEAFMDVGLCVLAGIFVFIIIEMLAAHTAEGEDTNVNLNNNIAKPTHEKKEVVGYLNLIANGIDNFTHGLAVGGSFLVSYKTGILTTAAILIHEIPHEIGDFAILMKSGFSRWGAARAQLYTAGIGLLGALSALYIGSSSFLGNVQVYVLGFTAGGFLNIALVTVLPDLLQETRPTHSAAQLVFILLGTTTMAGVALIC